MNPFIAETAFFALIIAIVAGQAERFDKNIPISKWFHLAWATVFAAIIMIFWWLSHKDWLFAGALVIERFVFFNPVLNMLRHPRKPFFYIHSDNKTGSWWDRVLAYVYKPVWVLAMVGFIILQFFL